MSFKSGVAFEASPRDDGRVTWFVDGPRERNGGMAHDHVVRAHAAARPGPIPETEAQRLRHVIEEAVGGVFGVPCTALSTPSRGKAPVARARQAAMYLAHVSCGLNLTDVGQIFARDRTTVAHACAVIEDRRDDPVFDRALELMEWIVPTLVGQDRLHAPHDI